MVREHGVAHYCKIDIEGNDRACIAHLPNHLAPEYISIEMSHRDGNVDLQILQDLGYTRFKIISQRTLVPPNRLAAQVASWFPVGRQVFYRVERLVRGIRSQDGWRFPLGSSGPFGERTGGRWLSFDDALRTWSFLSALDAKAGTNGLADWFDIHATR